MEGNGIKLDQFPTESNRNAPSDPSVGIDPQNTDFLLRTLPQKNRLTLSKAAQDATTNPNYYPLPIASEKIEKALILYTHYLSEIALGAAPDSAPSANVKIPSSTPSEQRHTSISDSTSAYSELSSAATFDEGTGEMKRLTTRARRKISPSARAKAALIRYLGSCAPCRQRRVPLH
ncbi:hypothetical protein N431DRAFT_92559 [Stipitochalara longipes BDJ]|nr:hypothetical protein N431DRAFT_92559 [Stipitochalara longipes BDJ]